VSSKPTPTDFPCKLFNAQSLNAKSKRMELQLLLQSEKYKIVLVTETWLDECTTDAMLCENTNFRAFRNDRLGRAGGVCIFAHKSLKTLIRKIPAQFSNIEVVCIDVIFGADKARFACIYRAPISEIKLPGYCANMCDLISVLCDVRHAVYVAGDFNFPSINWDSLSLPDNGSIESVFVECLLQNNLTQFVTEPTRDKNVLDLIVSNVENGVFDVRIVEPFLSSDHCAIEFSVLGPVSQSALPSPHRDFKNADYDLINGFLSNVEWEMLFAQCQSDVQDYWDVFISVVNSAIEAYVPMKTHVQGKAKHSKNVRKLKSKRKKLYRENKLAELKQCTKDYKLALKDQYESRENQVVNNGDVNGLYRYVKSKLASKSDVMPLRNNSGQLALYDSDKVKVLSSRFCSVYTDDDGVLPAFEPRVADDVCLDNVQFSVASVYQALRKLPNKVSNTPDGLPPIFLKRVACSIAAPLAEIYSMSFRTGLLPRIWLTANVVPVYKKNDPSDALNYRPISLTCICCKVMESIVREEVMKHVTKHKLVSEHQHGFLSKKSTCTQLLECQRDWTNYLTEFMGIDIVYLDFAKAFDTVSHQKLIHKLAGYGICGSMLTWIKAFLHNRTQRVMLNGAFSDAECVKSSVPQGSVLGPTLFVLYINDIVECVSALPVKIKLFADDVKLYCGISDSEFLQIALDRVAKWADTWQLKLAKSKCTVLNLGRSSGAVYTIDTEPLVRDGNCRDLGVQLTSSCKSSVHCSLIAKKAMRRAGMIFRAFSSRNVDTMLKAYTVYVRPLLECATPTWCPYLKKDIIAVEKVQKFYTRALFKRSGLQKSNYFSRLQYLRLDTLEMRRVRNDLQMYYKIIHCESVIDRNMFVMCNSRTRGHSKKLTKPFCRSDYLENSFGVRRIKLWNSLPEYVVSSPSVSVFLSRLSNSYIDRECKFSVAD